MRSASLKLIISTFLIICISAIGLKVIVWVNYINHTSFKRTKTIFANSGNYDLLMLGSSRMKNTVNPAIIDSILQVSSFNAGQNAASLIEDEMILQGYLRMHPKPKYILLGLDAFSFNNYLGFKESYLPYYKVGPVEKKLKAGGVRTYMYNLLPFLMPIEYGDYYKSSLLKVSLGRSELKAGDYYYKGYESNTLDHIVDSITTPNYEKAVYPLTGPGKTALENIVSICKQKKILLFFISAPEYKSYNLNSVANKEEIIGFYNMQASKNKIKFFRDDSLELCNNASLFANVGHLNRKGANIYTMILATRLKEYLTQRNNNP
jgi:hypothetical protein